MVPNEDQRLCGLSGRKFVKLKGYVVKWEENLGWCLIGG